MRVLLLTQWFEPEPAFKGLVFARALRDAGHEVQVLTGFPNYPGGRVYPGYRVRFLQREKLDGIPVVRVPLYPSHDRSPIRRTLNYISFAVATSLIGPFVVRRPDVVYVYQPPATAAMAGLLMKVLFDARLVVDVQDLWPETLKATGMITSRAVLGIVGLWCRLVFRFADHVVVLSQGFRNRLVERGVATQKISVVLNWAGDEHESPGAVVETLRYRAGLPSDALVILYAGNIGRAQNLSALLPALAHPAVRSVGIYLVLMGAGLEQADVARQATAAGCSNVRFVTAVAKSEARVLLREADGLLVHLRSDPLFAITIPSKIQSYLCAGVPIIAGVSGEARELVTTAGAGLVFQSDDPQDFIRVLLEFAQLPRSERAKMGLAGQRFYEAHLSLRRAVEATSNLLRGLSQ